MAGPRRQPRAARSPWWSSWASNARRKKYAGEVTDGDGGGPLVRPAAVIGYAKGRRMTLWLPIPTLVVVEPIALQISTRTEPLARLPRAPVAVFTPDAWV